MRVVFQETDAVTGVLVHEPVDVFTAGEVFVLAGLTTRGDDVSEMSDTQVLMIPTADPKAMLETLGSEESDGQLSVSIMNKTLVADTTDNYVLLADRPEILDEVEASKGTMQSLVAAPVAKGMDNLDLVIGIVFVDHVLQALLVHAREAVVSSACHPIPRLQRFKLTI